MDTTTLRQGPAQGQRPIRNDELLAELRATRRELAILRRLFDEFAGAFLNARFPFGKPADRWGQR